MGWFAEARNPELRGLTKRFRNCSISEVARLIADNRQFKPIFDRGVYPRPPLEESIVLESIADDQIVIRAGTRNDHYWSYVMDFEQDDDDVVLEVWIENPTKAAFPQWHVNIETFNRELTTFIRV